VIGPPRVLPRVRAFPTLLVLLGAAFVAGCGGIESTTALEGDAGTIAPLHIDPPTVAFGETLVNQSSAVRAFTIRNTATATISTVVVRVGGSAVNQFSITSNGCMGPLGRNAACMVSVVFKPTSPGEKTGTLDIDAGAARKSATLTGKAISPARVTAAPMDGDFGGVAVGSRSAPKFFTIRNEGGIDAAGIEVKVSGEMFEAVGAGCNYALDAGDSCTQAVVFAPRSEGIEMGVLTVIMGGAGAQMVTIQLLGTGVARPAVVALPSSVDFNPLGVGRTSAPTTITVKNPGGSSVRGLAAEVSSPDFVVGASTCSSAIAPGAACSVEVLFSPQRVGARKGELALSVMGGDSVGVPLAGSGVRAAALLIAPHAPNFGSVPALASSTPLTLIVRNEGQEEITDLSLTLSGADSGAFQLTSGCGSTLPPTGACPVVVVFRPGKEGAAAATLRASGSVAGTGREPPAAETRLAGTGVKPPAITVSPADPGFGTVVVGQTSEPINVTITNTGGAATGPLRVTTVGAEFKIVPGTDGCNDVSLAAGRACVVSIVFSPSGAGERTSPLTVVAEPGGALSAMLAARGAVGARLQVDRSNAGFGPVGVGRMSSEVIFTVTNAGDAETGLIGLATGSSQFVISSNGCQNETLGPGDSCSAAVRFVAASPGDFGTELRISANPGGAVNAALTALGTPPAAISFQEADGRNLSILTFQTVPVGTQSSARGVRVFVRNTGQSSSGTLTTRVVGNDREDFGIVAGSNTCRSPLGPGGQCSMSVFLKPTQEGDRDATINVTAAAGGVASLLLQGTGQGPLQIQNPPGTQVSSFDFGELTSALRGPEVTFTVAAAVDTGTYTVSFDDGGTHPNFARSGGDCETTPQIAAGSSCTIRIRFQPQSTGRKAGRLTVTTSAGVSTRVDLSGTGTGPLQFWPRPHNFGDLSAGSVAEQVFDLHNRGPHAMNPVAVTLTGSSDYVVSADSCATAPLAGGASCTVTVRFVPTTPGAKAATLSATGTFVAAGTSQMASAAVPITGNATEAAEITVDPDTHDFGPVAVGSTGVSQTFRVANGSGRPTTGGVTFDTTQATADFVISRNSCLLADDTTAAPLAAGTSCTFDVQFLAGAPGPRAGVIRVFATPGGSVTLRLAGTGISSLVSEPGAREFDAASPLKSP
jgi:hypothetical protein